MQQITLSIVHYRQKELLRRCLDHIQKLNLPQSYETIVVENSPEKDGVDMILNEFKWVRLLNPEINLGFGGGHNLSFVNSNSQFFVVLNPDILVLKNSLEILIQVLIDNSKISIVGPCLLNPDGSMQYSARRFYNWNIVLRRRLPWFNRAAIDSFHLMKNCDLSKQQKVDWILGAAMAIRRTAFPKNQLFDPRYKLYFEDVDLCYFTQINGWDVVYCPESKMIHDHQRMSAKGFFNKAVCYHFQSWFKFWLKTKKLIN